MESGTDAAAWLGTLDRTLARVRSEGEQRLARWRARDGEHWGDFAPSAHNLACYLALRHEDLRPLQRALMLLGLSSLGRLESRVLPGLEAARASLAAVAGAPSTGERPTPADFFAGEQRLAERRAALFGPPDPRRPVALMVTCPVEAATDAAFMRGLAERGVESLRINCAHDDAALWQAMIDHARAAWSAVGPAPHRRAALPRPRIFVDLAGPKIRTGGVRLLGDGARMRPGDRIALVHPGSLDGLPEAAARFAAECTLSEALAAAAPGERVLYDDGKLIAAVEQSEPWGLVLRVERCPEKGVKLKPEKGLNFPETGLGIAALTDKDRADLDFVAAQADGVGLSFVQSADDVAALQQALAERRPDWQRLALVLKIETPRAVANLPEIVVQAASRQPAAIMIARGDLAVEMGFARTAEMQEEILWIGEAAQIPVIWATQVLEELVKDGTPSRSEMTDAAMAARAECVMLNKGPYLLQAIDTLDTLLVRMGEHQYKKTPQLRRLNSW